MADPDLVFNMGGELPSLTLNHTNSILPDFYIAYTPVCIQGSPCGEKRKKIFWLLAVNCQKPKKITRVKKIIEFLKG